MNFSVAIPRTIKGKMPLRTKGSKPANERLRRSLLRCGILSSLLYIALNIFVPMYCPGYNSASQTVSELSAIGAPTRQLWFWLCIPYTLLVIAFAWGVWKSAGQNRPLRIAGSLMIVYGTLGFFWPFAPMHFRETLAVGGATFSDTLIGHHKKII